jgi:hypothetical protein
VSMGELAHITLTVHYDRASHCERSLRWIAPELRHAGLTLIRDRPDDHPPSRTWAGYLDNATFHEFAEAWEPPAEIVTPDRANDDAFQPSVRTYTLDGMNWETNEASPIVCVTLCISADPRPRGAPSSSVTSIGRSCATFGDRARRRLRRGSTLLSSCGMPGGVVWRSLMRTEVLRLA